MFAEYKGRAVIIKITGCKWNRIAISDDRDSWVTGVSGKEFIVSKYHSTGTCTLIIRESSGRVSYTFPSMFNKDVTTLFYSVNECPQYIEEWILKVLEEGIK